MKDKITCRPCKEEKNWEIEDQHGKVLDKHYNTRKECVNAADKMAEECGCELYVCPDCK